MNELQRVQDVYTRYVEAPNALLTELKLGRNSNRDPLAEFSEWLVAAILGGTLAPSQSRHIGMSRRRGLAKSR